MSERYPKIQTVCLRDPATNMRHLLDREWSKPEFRWLKNMEWIWTEKVDGANIRIDYDGRDITIKGRTDKANLAPFVQDVIAEILGDRMGKVFQEPVCLYGEFYGDKINKGRHYLGRGEHSFILFDVKIGEYWLQWKDVCDIADKIDIHTVPVINRGTLDDAISLCQRGFPSAVSIEGRQAEGLVLRPPINLWNQKGERVMSKVKLKDFPR